MICTGGGGGGAEGGNCAIKMDLQDRPTNLFFLGEGLPAPNPFKRGPYAHLCQTSRYL
jgi:hypothetical protein